PSMSRSDMQRVYRLLKEAREEGVIPWHHIVDETRGIERVPQWDDPDDYAEATVRDYRRDFWTQQPERCEVWSEKGTVRGVLKPLLDRYGVGFNPVHGFTSATDAHDAAVSRDPRPLTALYVLIGTPAVCACPSVICRTGWKGTAATTSRLSA